MSPRLALTPLLVGAAIAAGILALPIDGELASLHLTRKLTRDALVGARPAKTLAGHPVRLYVDAGPDGLARLAPLVDLPTLAPETPDGPYRYAFLPTGRAEGPPPDPPGAGAEPLVITARQADGALSVEVRLGEHPPATRTARLADRWSLLPPLVALVLALGLRKIIWAMLFGVLAGGTVLLGGNPFAAVFNELRGLGSAALRPFGVQWAAGDGYLGRVLADTFNLQILGFTFVLVGLVAIIGRMGGTRGLVDRLAPLVKGPRSAQGVTALMGTAVFFDDYANTVVVGTTARSLTDRFRISREKLAYIVDSTSAPVAGIAIISTWIGYEVGLFNDLLPGLRGLAEPFPYTSGYAVFFAALPLRFYCLFALALIFLVALTGRDLRPMLAAERRARRGGPDAVHPSGRGHPAMALEKPGLPPRARNAILPIGAVLLAVPVWIGLRAGEGFAPGSLTAWKEAFSAAADDIAFILLGAALIGTGVALALAFVQRLLTPREAAGAFLAGVRTLLEAASILVLAWAIKAVCDDLSTGMAIIALVGESLPAAALPLVVFLLSGVVAFSTGTSWGTMALVLPVAAPLAATISGETLIIIACLAAVLDGAIWGDHCSPISDTTVLSSTASGCPHLEHVRTQLPYATLAMLAAAGAGYGLIALGLATWISYALGLALMLGALLILGRSPDAPN